MPKGPHVYSNSPELSPKKITVGCTLMVSRRKGARWFHTKSTQNMTLSTRGCVSFCRILSTRGCVSFFGYWTQERALHTVQNRYVRERKASTKTESAESEKRASHISEPKLNHRKPCKKSGCRHFRQTYLPYRVFEYWVHDRLWKTTYTVVCACKTGVKSKMRWLTEFSWTQKQRKVVWAILKAFNIPTLVRESRSSLPVYFHTG